MRAWALIPALLLFLDLNGADSQMPVVVENAHFRYTIGADGLNQGFISLASGKDYLDAATPSPCALIRRDRKEHRATSAMLAGGRLVLGFGDTGIETVLRVERRPSFVQLMVEAIRGGEVEALTFLNVPLTLQGRPDEPFGACAYSLNLRTRVDQLPVLQTALRASSHRKFGIVGAKAAIVALPTSGMLSALKELLAEADEMHLCRVAGPWAQEAPFSHGSYLFNFGDLTESTVGDWIDRVQSVGFTQIDNHGGSSAFFRFGDFQLNREKWPSGWDTYARIVARLHSAGISSIFHSYAFFIDKQSRYVTPVPDHRLDAFRVFTLAEGISADADTVLVRESTAGISTVTGFFEQNSVVLHLGDELMKFGAASSQPPWRFTGLERGAFGTTASPHAAGSRARHLKECFGLFVPDPESSLFEEIAANHADIVNRCGFDGIYLDAIDGSSILRGADECWHWADKFVFEIQKRLWRPVGMEMSAMWHHFWQYRTRWQAWDFPQRGYQRFIDLHTEAVNGGLLLPLHLGWWCFHSSKPPQVEPTYPEVIDYLGAKLVGWDAGISLVCAIDNDRLNDMPLFRRAVEKMRAFENLRASGAIDDRVRAALREPGREFALETDAGKPRFRPSHSDAHTVAAAEPWTLEWPMTNQFTAQPVRFRIEALMSTAAHDDTNAIVLADLGGSDAPAWKLATAEGVTCALEGAGADDGRFGILMATNGGVVPRAAAWSRFTKRFEPPLDLKERQALGALVEADASGALLAIRLESPQHLAYGAVADRYIPLDFTGRRHVVLVETESARWSDYKWNDGKSLYNVYRETIDFGAIDSVSIWCQNLPQGREVKCRLGPVTALAMLPCAVKDPVITINETTLVLPVELASGSWIEANGPDDCQAYGANGELLGKVTPRGDWPALREGPNAVRFSCAPTAGPAPRGRVTLFSRGDEL